MSGKLSRVFLNADKHLRQDESERTIRQLGANDEWMHTERLFGMFDAVSGILMTASIATTGLAFVESEDVCAVVKASKCVGGSSRVMVSPLNGWVPLMNRYNLVGLSMFRVARTCYDHGFNETLYCATAEATYVPTTVNHFFIRHHFFKIIGFVLAFIVATKFWTKHVVATRSVHRGPTCGLMAVHALLVLLQGIVLIVFSVYGTIAVHEVQEYANTHSDALVFASIEFNEGIQLFLGKVAWCFFSLTLWSLATANLEYWAVKWRTKPSQTVIPPRTPVYGFLGTTIYCPFPIFVGKCRSLPGKFEAGSSEILNLDVPGVWAALTVLRCTEALRNALLYFLGGLFCLYFSNTMELLGGLNEDIQNAIFTSIFYSILLMMFRIFTDTTGQGWKGPLSKSCSKSSADPKASPWKIAYALDQYEQTSLSRTRVHVFSDGVFAIISTVILLEMEIEETTHTFSEFIEEQGPKVICTVLVWFLLFSLWGLHRRVFREHTDDEPLGSLNHDSEEGAPSAVHKSHAVISHDDDGDDTINVHAVAWSHLGLIALALCPLAMGYAHFFPTKRLSTIAPFVVIFCAVQCFLTSAVNIRAPHLKSIGEEEADGVIATPFRCHTAPLGRTLIVSKRCAHKHCDFRSEAVWFAILVVVFGALDLAVPRVEWLWMCIFFLAATLTILTDVQVGLNLCGKLARVVQGACRATGRKVEAISRPFLFEATTDGGVNDDGGSGVVSSYAALDDCAGSESALE